MKNSADLLEVVLEEELTEALSQEQLEMISGGQAVINTL